MKIGPYKLTMIICNENFNLFYTLLSAMPECFDLSDLLVVFLVLLTLILFEILRKNLTFSSNFMQDIRYVYKTLIACGFHRKKG